MKLLERLFGSRYNKDIPYTYHASYRIFEDPEELTRDWFGDTFCSVCNHLRSIGVQPASVTIYECYAGSEVEMPKASYADEKGEWMVQESLCEAHVRYGSPGAFEDCKFSDRDKTKVI
ncbi:MAG: hypothetical protein IPJ33_11115 [Gammaproteobacteria bacterium]|nr:hypothetical protein [Gammaproteobacteria bacterium]MBP6050986.1 hypothetical protein [Pseudomonadales bacterium]MBK6582493.1 hypothetical protein [Gammaproteobacteria bacterium]MBK7169638.1 hypothetical protein [Gammaproteobacteria bacterium]MBK7521239.1 hypothetical protein [Gammaproteobacteria bacterium]